ncbi:hypothetical protein F0562_001401 [Nyssa sinensis]|uniref:Beta-glucosidase n=1 Tax=Nyssa sinensis TaxID=561372 RepID=A0A5J5C7G0_9ASTE|nr:hypothetical protein F0562_001401 [Nyssa sinensis]
MEIEGHLLLVLLIMIANAVTSSSSSLAMPRNYGMHLIDRKSEPLSPNFGLQFLNRSSFPQGFVFGAASSAYQVEGGTNTSTGKGPSIWDTFTHTYPEKIQDQSNGDVAIDSYYQYKEDVKLIKEMGLDAYRFSISWSRVLPSGKLSGGVNKEGIKYYTNLINELRVNDSYVTLFHWDVPQALEDEYDGFLSHKIVDDFRDYADLCFKIFGNLVKHWTTLNEPWSFSDGYATGAFAPGRCSSWLENNCTKGESGTEPYIVTHHQLLAHATVVKLYKEKYQASQQGIIGITLVSNFFVPYSNSSSNRRASLRGLDFMLGWFMEPLIYGHYPATMRLLVRNRLPQFSEENSTLVKGSFDFIGINYYTAYYARNEPSSNMINVSYTTDSRVNQTAERNGVFIGEQAGSDWLYIYPKGIWDLLLYMKKKYNNPPIYITENGIDEVNNSTLSLKQARIDNFRINYYYRHLYFVRQAIKDGVDVRGYFAWALLDNFEWNSGFTVRFGINYVDFENGYKRYPKLSAEWFKQFLKK